MRGDQADSGVLGVWSGAPTRVADSCYVVWSLATGPSAIQGVFWNPSLSHSPCFSDLCYLLSLRARRVCAVLAKDSHKE